jgi:hypothetical protein
MSDREWAAVQRALGQRKGKGYRPRGKYASVRNALVKQMLAEFNLVFVSRESKGFAYELIESDKIREWLEARLFQAYDAGVDFVLHPTPKERR